MIEKLKSVKNWLLLWLVIIISFIVFSDHQAFLPLAQNLAWAVLGYFGANTLQKKIFTDRDIKMGNSNDV